MLAELAPREAEVHGLVALMEIQASRTAARTGPGGEPIPLEEQDRGRWDPLLIGRGFAAMLRARDLGGRPGPYVLQAAVAIGQAQARRPEDTDWAQIATLYDALVTLMPTPIVQLNRAVAIERARGPQDGLAVVDTLVDDPVLRDYHLLPSVRGDLLARVGRTAEARLEFERAAALTANVTEQAFLRRRADELAVAPATGPTLGAAAREFLDRGDLVAATRRSYAQTLRRLGRTLGEQLPLHAVTPERVAAVPHRPPPRAGRGPLVSRPLPVHRPAAPVLRARGVPLQAGDPAAGPVRAGVHAAPAAGSLRQRASTDKYVR
ncbi:MAG: RNA polymerase sigma factor [Micromonosporaceae bacterium]